MKLKIAVFLVMLIFAVLTISGCWDMVDIDRRFFVGNIGIDKAPVEGKIKVEFTMPIVRKISGEGGQGGGGGGSTIATVSTLANSIHSASRQMSRRLSRRLFFEHTRVILIGEEAARDGIEGVVNFLSRNTEVNRRGRIMVVKGKAEDALKAKNEYETLLALYISNIFENWNFCSRFVEITIDDFLKKAYTTKGNVLLPRLTPGKTDVSIGGAAVVKKYKLVGWLDEDETLGVNFVLGKVRGGDLTFKKPGMDYPVVMSIVQISTKMELIEAGTYPKFKITPEILADIVETPVDMKIDESALKKLEKDLEGKVNQIILKGVKKVQKEFQVDVLGFGEYLYKYKPDVWEYYKEDWENVFPDAEIIVDTKATIRGIGAYL
ncbi:spore germination protein KC [Caldanaerovirga acetigignens]|uniref:Spore germination protein KC n=1 Tax=Caldanaerovirga acetigignens TaxID=447595 RepID=A0A1M7GJ77_9FIRM|nr:Ger(x)C family spore germination protein [Caldanaerovirga acetigignens]SHM15919.1 spore germination protein KC [Caldanaerovirga acetigignens]